MLTKKLVSFLIFKKTEFSQNFEEDYSGNGRKHVEDSLGCIEFHILSFDSYCAHDHIILIMWSCGAFFKNSYFFQHLKKYGAEDWRKQDKDCLEHINFHFSSSCTGSEWLSRCSTKSKSPRHIRFP